MLAIFSQTPDPLPVALSPAERIQSMPGDVMVTWSDMVPADGTILMVVAGVWVAALLFYSFSKFFKAPTEPEQAVAA